MIFNTKKIELTKGMQYGIGFSLIIFAITFSAWVIVLTALSPYRAIKHEILALVQEKTDIVNYADFSIYNNSESYYVVKGANEAGEEALVLVSEDKSNVSTYLLNDGISEKDAIKAAKENGAEEISSVNFGQIDGQAVWEIGDNGSFYLISFQDGKLVKKEG